MGAFSDDINGLSQEGATVSGDLSLSELREEENQESDLFTSRSASTDSIDLYSTSNDLSLIGQNESNSGSTSNSTTTTSTDTGADTGAEILVSAWAMPAESEIGWHIDSINARNTWADYTGNGIIVAVVDNGWHSYNHADLDDNIRFDLADAGALNGLDHGQNTIGLIGAEANGSQSVGVSFNADLVPELWTNQGIIDATAYADVINNSWTYKNPLNAATQGNQWVIDDAVTNGRGGLGSNVVFSAGNYRTEDIGANVLPMQSSPHIIVVGAMDPDGTETWFSSAGSSLLVTAPGINLFTTDGANGTTANFAGTSGSAPIVSGAVALILEANASLGFRDVQEIIAYSTKFNDSGSANWDYNTAGNWNGGGLHFSNDHGFGLIDVLAATRLAETWQEQSTIANMQTINKSAVVNLAIPDGGSFLQSSINVTGAENILVETVVVNVDVDGHGEVGDLIITIISPNGTSAVLMDTPQFGATGLATLDFDFGVQKFRGEDASGNWTLRIEDTAGGNAGTLADWSLTINGDTIDNNDTYFYNDQFSLYNADGSRTTLTDSGGTDTINASMVTTGSNISLVAGSTSTIDGTTLTIAGGTTIENVYGGDGNDILTGNASNNTLWGGRGSDTIDGGGGYDISEWLEDFVDFTISFSGSTLIADLAGSISDTVNNVEEFVFNGVSYLYNDLQTLFGTSNDFAPVNSVTDLTLDTGASTLASSVIGATDADGNALTYEVWDSQKSSNTGYFELSGTRLAGGMSHSLTQSQFDVLNIVGGSQDGNDTLWLRASDGVHITTWESFTLTTTNGSGIGFINTTPTTTANNLTLDNSEIVLASTIITAADADGDALSYTVWDSGTKSSSGYFELGGVQLSAGTGHTISQAQFDTLNIIGGAQDDTETLWVRVSDGMDTSNWQSFTLTTTGGGAGGGVNNAPTATTSNLTLDIGATVLASTTITVTDIDGDALSYEVWDSGTKSNSGYFELNGVRLTSGTSNSLTQADFDVLNIVGGNTNDTETLWIKVSDGTDATNWQSFTLTTTDGSGGGMTGSAPIATASDLSLGLNSSVLASTTITASDIDGDVLSYEVWDSGTKSSTGYFELSGAKLSSGTGHTMTQAQFDTLNIVGGTQNGSETLWVRASDGTYTTNWKSFTLNTTDALSLEVSDILDMGSPDDIGSAIDELSAPDEIAPPDALYSGVDVFTPIDPLEISPVIDPV